MQVREIDFKMTWKCLLLWIHPPLLPTECKVMVQLIITEQKWLAKLTVEDQWHFRYYLFMSACDEQPAGVPLASGWIKLGSRWVSDAGIAILLHCLAYRLNSTGLSPELSMKNRIAGYTKMQANLIGSKGENVSEVASYSVHCCKLGLYHPQLSLRHIICLTTSHTITTIIHQQLPRLLL